MDTQWMNEQELSYAWSLNSPSAEISEQEGVLDWLKSIGSGAAQGAGTGSATGPWGTLVGGLVGAGLGALQQAKQRQSIPSQRTVPSSPPPAVSKPAPMLPMAPSSQMANSGADAAIQQFIQLLPQLSQLVQAIQPIVASIPQNSGRPNENIIEGGNSEALAGDFVPDSDFLGVQADETSETDEDLLTGLPQEKSVEDTSFATPNGIQSRGDISLLTTLQPILSFSGEWGNEGESVSLGQSAAFRWVG